MIRQTGPDAGGAHAYRVVNRTPGIASMQRAAQRARSQHRQAEVVAPMADLPQMLTVPEVADALRCHPKTVLKYCADGRLRSVKLARVLVYADSVAELLGVSAAKVKSDPRKRDRSKAYAAMVSQGFEPPTEAELNALLSRIY